ncbi:HAMP domain-containing sensor histidine kinase [Streptomyces sp. NPDC005251]|uniref:HAMP domain-containing sensor histidine kinase n=1 Tax=unclassified Streptomyces TaxID=2593676 RepID=UPI0033A00C11
MLARLRAISRRRPDPAGRLRADDLVLDQEQHAERDGRTLTVAYGPATVRVDPRWLEPAVGTLLDNALRHGRGAIVVRAEARDGRLSLSVSDEGPGFPPDFLPHAFDRFSRAEASRTTPGAGLGLALVAAVAASHGGTARAANISPGAMGGTGVTEAAGAAVTLDVPC